MAKKSAKKAAAKSVKTCTFGKAWSGKCGQPAVTFNRCKDHQGLKCSSCGRVATGECDETQGPMVCGTPLCDRCEHALAPNGTNSGNKHILKGTQKYKSWWEQTADEERQGKYLMLKRELAGYDHVAALIGGEKGSVYLNETVDVRRRIAAEQTAMEKEHPELVGLSEEA